MGYYDTSYPPSLWAPKPIPATGVTPGVPGSFTPVGCVIPANLTALKAMGALGETTAWITGQYVVLGDASNAHWDGATWITGIAADPVIVEPPPEPSPEPPPDEPPDETP